MYLCSVSLKSVNVLLYFHSLKKTKQKEKKFCQFQTELTIKVGLGSFE